MDPWGMSKVPYRNTPTFLEQLEFKQGHLYFKVHTFPLNMINNKRGK